MSLVVGLIVLLVSLAHISPSLDVLNHFDPPKMCIWGGLFMLLAVGWADASPSEWDRTAGLAMGLAGWIIARTLCRPDASRELGVLGAWLVPLFLFMLGRLLTVRFRDVRWGLLLALLFQSVVMLGQRYGFDPFFPDTTRAMDYVPGRMIGTIGYHNQALDFIALCGSVFFVMSRKKFARVAGLLLVLCLAVLTSSRGGILASTCAISLGELALRASPGATSQFRWRHVGVVGIMLLMAVCFSLVIPSTRDRFRSLWQEGSGSAAVASRIIMDRVAVEMWMGKPLVGWGAGEYAYQYLDRLASVLPAEKTHSVLRSVVFAREAHNDYLQFLAEFGLIGVGLVLAIGVVVFRQCWCARHDRPDTFAALVYLVGYLLVAGVVSFPWQACGSGPLAGLLLGSITVDMKPPGGVNVPGKIRRWGMRLAKSVVLVVTVLLLGLYLMDFSENLFWSETAAHAEQACNAESPRALFPIPAWEHRYSALLGATCAWVGAYDVAESMLRHALAGYQDIPLYTNLGFVLSQRGKWADATELYERWASTGINHNQALNNLSIAYEHIGRRRDAIRTIQDMLRLWPDAADADIRRLAVLQMQERDAAGALGTVEAFERKIMRKGRKLPPELENIRGAAFMEMGRYGEARRSLEVALEGNPGLESARRNLAQLEELVRRRDGVR